MYETTQISNQHSSHFLLKFMRIESLGVAQRFSPLSFLFFFFLALWHSNLCTTPQVLISHMLRKETTATQATFNFIKSFIRSLSLYDVFETLVFFLTDVIKSGIGFLVWFAGLTAWILVYQKYRASWGEIGDRISFVIPLGEP